MQRKIALEIIAFLFIILFVYAALMKLFDVEKFSVQIGQSPLLTNMAGFIAWFIPSIEIVISILLAIQRFRLIGLFAAFTLMIMFTAYIIVILNFSEHIPCSCGGVLERMGWKEHLVFNIAFSFLGLTGIILYRKQETDKQVTVNL